MKRVVGKKKKKLFWFLVDGFAPGTGSVLVALSRGWITLGNRSQGLHGAKMGGLCHSPTRQNGVEMGNLEAKQHVPGPCLVLEGPNTKRLQRKERGDPLPGLQNPPRAGCCHQLGPPLSPCSPKTEKLAQERLFLQLCHLTGTLKAGKSRRNVPPLHPRALWGILLQAHSWRDEHF